MSHRSPPPSVMSREITGAADVSSLVPRRRHQARSVFPLLLTAVALSSCSFAGGFSAPRSTSGRVPHFHQSLASPSKTLSTSTSYSSAFVAPSVPYRITSSSSRAVPIHPAAVATPRTESGATASSPALLTSQGSGSPSLSSLFSSSSPNAGEEFDVTIVGLGVGGHAAALHAAALGMKVAVVSGGDPGGTCVNRGCVPSKALLATAKRVKMLRNKHHMAAMGLELGADGVRVDPRGVSRHATGVVDKVATKFAYTEYIQSAELHVHRQAGNSMSLLRLPCRRVCLLSRRRKESSRVSRKQCKC